MFARRRVSVVSVYACMHVRVHVYCAQIVESDEREREHAYVSARVRVYSLQARSYGLRIRVGILMLIPSIDYETGGNDRPELPSSWNFRDS
jgi:hypothetical protein